MFNKHHLIWVQLLNPFCLFHEKDTTIPFKWWFVKDETKLSTHGILTGNNFRINVLSIPLLIITQPHTRTRTHNHPHAHTHTHTHTHMHKQRHMNMSRSRTNNIPSKSLQVRWRDQMNERTQTCPGKKMRKKKLEKSQSKCLIIKDALMTLNPRGHPTRATLEHIILYAISTHKCKESNKHVHICVQSVHYIL